MRMVWKPNCISMNCPQCKNPIQDNITECEWCGQGISNDLNTSNTNFIVEQIFQISGRGTVLVGNYSNITQINCGDSISYTHQGIISNAIVVGIEVSGKLINSYNGNQKIGILIK